MSAPHPAQAPANIPAELLGFLQSGVSLIVGTRDSGLRPEVVRAVALRINPDGASATVYMPVATSALTRDNLNDNGQIAVCATEPKTHRSLQLKGKVTRLRDAREDERPLIEQYVVAFADELAIIGLPVQITMRLRAWPAYAAEFEVADLFVQTPGPKAGFRVEKDAK